MDVLTDLLQRSRARGAAFSHSTVHGPWGVDFPSAAGLAVHAIVDGEAHMWTGDDGPPTHLLPGDLVLVRGGTPHHLAHAPYAACLSWAGLEAAGVRTGSARRLHVGDPADGHAAAFFCGAYLFEGDLCASLLRALPETVRVRPACGSSLRATMDLLAGEMLRDDPGQQALLDRLLDVALVQVLREHFTGLRDGAPGWFRATGDPPVADALHALHADPARPWTVAALAAEANLSRAAFARRFTEVVGEAPLAYLTEWRMALAREQLRDGDEGLAAIAASVGYASEFSFAAAFKRHTGIAPGRWRGEARASHARLAA